MGTARSTAESAAERVRDRIPTALRKTFASAGDNHTLTLAAGLAFFGILSIGPAVGVGFGLVRLLVSADAADAIVDLLRDSFPEQLGLGDLVDQMKDRAGRYAGIGFLVLLWPATTLATGGRGHSTRSPGRRARPASGACAPGPRRSCQVGSSSPACSCCSPR